jgi:hypothetical protein
MTDKIEYIKNLRKSRLDICKNCEFFNKITTQCNQCGCIMSVKSMLVDSKCPKEKW